MVSPLLLLGFTGASALFKPALDSLGAAGPGGLSEIVYAYASTVADNGSAFAGLSANTPWYNVTTGLAMFFGRFAHAIPILAIAGSLAAKKKAKPSAGTVQTNDATFLIFCSASLRSSQRCNTCRPSCSARSPSTSLAPKARPFDGRPSMSALLTA
jgi:K+-transporting ATPase A subunit